MLYEQLHQSIRRQVDITEEEWQLIASAVVIRTFKKGEMISREGEVNRFTNFIEKGSARVYHIDHLGNEHVVQLAIPGWWTGDFPSFIMQQKGMLYAEALETTRALSFSYDQMEAIFRKVPAFERFYRLLIQRAYVSFQYRALHAISMDAEERYIRFRDAYPDMELHIPQKHIASYLGMSAEFLSKIKKRLYEKARQH